MIFPGRQDRHEAQDRAEFKRLRKAQRMLFDRIDLTREDTRRQLDHHADEAREAAERLATSLAETNRRRDEQIASLKRIVWMAIGGFTVTAFILKEIVIPIFVPHIGG